MAKRLIYELVINISIPIEDEDEPFVSAKDRRRMELDVIKSLERDLKPLSASVDAEVIDVSDYDTIEKVKA